MLRYDEELFDDGRLDWFIMMMAKQRFGQWLLKINQAIKNRQKTDAIVHLHSLIDSLNNPIGEFSCFEQKETFADDLKILEALKTALTVTDENQKSGAMAQIEEWHAVGKPKFILFLPELRKMVFRGK